MKSKQFTEIRNPLAVIAIFAGISEVAMAVTLVNIPTELQRIFVWFVMGFPLVLVSGFFFVLYKKPAVLFSPGDYQDDQLYLDSISPDWKEYSSNTRFDQIEASIQTLQSGLERLADKTPGGKEVKEEVAEEWGRQQALFVLKNNDLFSFMTSELGLTESDVLSIAQQSSDLAEMPKRLFELSGDQWKSDRLLGVINNFPKALSDFDALKATTVRR